MDILKDLLPASIALVGTVIAVVVSYRQWKRQQETARYGTYLVEKQSAYKELWEKLEDVHVKLRTEEVSLSEFNTLLREINSHILKHALYLDEEDQRLSNRYLEIVYRFKEALMGSGDEEALAMFTITASAMPEGLADEARILRFLDGELNRIRNAIIKRCKAVMSGT